MDISIHENNYVRGNILSTQPPVKLAPQSFGSFLKHWRKQQKISQLELALRSAVSQRHISFLESGRSIPSQAMILRLGQAMDLSLRTQNLMLKSAGYPAAFSQTHLDQPEMHAVKKALTCLLQQQEPFPAFVLDNHWRLLETNQAAQRLIGFLSDDQPLPDTFYDQGALNLMRLLLHPQGLHPLIENFAEVASHLLLRLQQESDPYSTDSLYTEMQALLPDIQPREVYSGQAPVLSTCIVKDDLRLELFSIISTLGTPTDITLQELRIESFFPANARTEEILRELAHR